MQNNQDTLHRFLFEDTPVRGNLVNLHHSYTKALQHQQDMPKGLKLALGELMAASTLLAATLKMQGSMVMQIQSKGPLKILVVECTADFGLRATAKWEGDITDDQTLFDVIEQGQFVITIDPKDGKQQAYQGIVPLEGDSISAILESYMMRSEQIDTRIWLACDGTSVGGLLMQKLPNTTNQKTLTEAEVAESLETWARVGYLAETIKDEELLTLDAQVILTRLFNDEAVRLFEPNQTKFSCSCSRTRVGNMLRSLGADEINSMIAEQEVIVINCDFCNQRYTYDEVDAKQLISSEIDTENPDNLH